MTDSGGRTLVTWTPMRAAIARRMSESNRDVPQFSVSTEVDMEPVLDAIGVLNADPANGRDDARHERRA